jgi:hypothetical protein
LGVAATLAVACGAARGPTERVRAARPSRTEPSCHYDVAVVRATAGLDVVAHCSGGATTGFAGDPHLATFTTDVRDARGVALPHDGMRWTVTASDDVEARYHVDLDGAARALGDVDTAFVFGGSVVAPLSSYALVPEPPRGGTASLRVRPVAGTEFVTELARDAGGYTIALTDVPDSTYGVFGRFEHDVVELGGIHGRASVDVLSLDGTFALSRAERKAWVARDAEAVARFYGGFPGERVGVVLIPDPGRDRVGFGKVLSTGGSTIVLHLGANTERSALDSDWVLVHEMFHVGFPAVHRDGMWLDEGLATYIEPLIRARAGMLTEAEGWAEVIRDMPRGVRLCETTGLRNFGGDIRSVYWGGAVVALLADVEARRATNGARGLEDALRAVLAKGYDARHVVAVDEAIRLIDEVFGAPILAALAAKYADHGSPVPLDGVLSDLGIERSGRDVRLHDDAPMAFARRAILYGAGKGPPSNRAFPLPGALTSR